MKNTTSITNKNIRRDIVSGKRFPKEKLLKIIVTKDKIILFDKHKNLLGRGYYFLNEEETFEKMFSKKILEKTFLKKGISKEKIFELQINIKKELNYG